MGLHLGEEAHGRVEQLTYQEGYEDDGYVLSSAAALTEPFAKGVPQPRHVTHREAQAFSRYGSPLQLTPW